MNSERKTTLSTDEMGGDLPNTNVPVQREEVKHNYLILRVVPEGGIISYETRTLGSLRDLQQSQVVNETYYLENPSEEVQRYVEQQGVGQFVEDPRGLIKKLGLQNVG